jgi:hypothetical protein
MMPTATFDGTAYTLTLFRNQKPKKIIFGSYFVTVHVAPEADVDPWIRSKVVGDAEDGLLYYMKAEYHHNGILLPHVGIDFYEWLNGTKEAHEVLYAIHQAELACDVKNCLDNFEAEFEAFEKAELRASQVVLARAPCSACGVPNSLCDTSHHVENFP